MADDPLPLLYPLEGWLVRQFPAVDPHLRTQAAHDAVLESLAHPTRVYPARRALFHRLRQYARYSLLHALRHEAHQAALPSRLADGAARTAPDALRVVCAREALRAAFAVPASVRRSSSVAELWLLELLLLRVAATDPAAHVLGAGGLAWPARRQAVRAAKDRVRKRYRYALAHSSTATRLSHARH